MRERRAIRMILAGMAFLTAVRAIETYGSWSTATDWTWFYRIGLPVAAAAFAYGAVRGHMTGNSILFAPICVVAIVRVVDFTQDWFLTPEIVEPIDLSQRLGPGVYGWGMIPLSALFIHMLERLMAARWLPPDSGHVCMNAPGCPSFVDVER